MKRLLWCAAAAFAIAAIALLLVRNTAPSHHVTIATGDGGGRGASSSVLLKGKAKDATERKTDSLGEVLVRVVHDRSQSPIRHAEVIFLAADGSVLSSHRTGEDGLVVHVLQERDSKIEVRCTGYKSASVAIPPMPTTANALGRGVALTQ